LKISPIENPSWPLLLDNHGSTACSTVFPDSFGWQLCSTAFHDGFPRQFWFTTLPANFGRQLAVTLKKQTREKKSLKENEFSEKQTIFAK